MADRKPLNGRSAPGAGSGACLIVAALFLPGTAIGRGPVSPPTPPAAATRAYLEAALDLMQRHALNSDSVDWPTLRAEAVARAGGASSPAETYDAIRFALRKLGDRHSFLMTPQATEDWRRRTVENNARPEVEALLPGLGYVALPGLHAIDPVETSRYATELQRRIAAIDAVGSGTCDWVVDLRRNRGGNMWPMLAGVGPILGEGEVGAFVTRDGARTPWYYRAGASWEGKKRRAGVTGPAHVLRRPETAVAVLTERATGSSGEAVVVAFRGRPNSRSFGGATAGLSTSNTDFLLADGAILFLTTSRFADRTGRTYGSVLEPDDRIEEIRRPGGGGGDGRSRVQDPVVAAAVRWLRRHPSCSQDL